MFSTPLKVTWLIRYLDKVAIVTLPHHLSRGFLMLTVELSEAGSWKSF
jgi:hypothetical protein